MLGKRNGSATGDRRSSLVLLRFICGSREAYNSFNLISKRSIQETTMKWISSVLLVSLALAGTPGSAQWAKRLDPSVPPTRDGKLDLAARAPQMRNDKVDLSATWR